MVQVLHPTEKDFNEISDIITSFINESLSAFCINGEHIASMMASHKDTSLILVKDTDDGKKIIGCIAGSLISSIVDGSLIMQELMWYVLPEHRRYGVKLLKEFEKFSKSLGAKKLVMVHLCNEQSYQIGELYKNMGYTPLEVQYVKEL